MKVLVTGGAGFIGSHIVDLLLETGYQPIVVDNLVTGDLRNIPQGVPFYCEDINGNGLEEIFRLEKPTYVIHQAAQVDIQTSLHDPCFDAEVNILGLLKVLDCCVKYPVRKFIYASSAAVYGEPEYIAVDEDHPLRPQSGYGISKSIGSKYLELYAKLYGLEYIVLRYANVYGPRQNFKGEGGLIPTFINALFEGKSPVIFGDGLQTRDFIFVKDVAYANLKSLVAEGSHIINIATNTQYSVLEIFENLKRLLGTPVEPVYKVGRQGEILNSCLDNQRAKQTLLWQPNWSLREGLIETIDYYRRIGGEGEVEKLINSSPSS